MVQFDSSCPPTFVPMQGSHAPVVSAGSSSSTPSTADCREFIDVQTQTIRGLSEALE